MTHGGTDRQFAALFEMEKHLDPEVSVGTSEREGQEAHLNASGSIHHLRREHLGNE